MNRREFLESSTAIAAGVAAFGWPGRVAAQLPDKPIAIQVGAVFFLDEGTDQNPFRPVVRKVPAKSKKCGLSSAKRAVNELLAEVSPRDWARTRRSRLH
jgi:hypothetical protein